MLHPFSHLSYNASTLTKG